MEREARAVGLGGQVGGGDTLVARGGEVKVVGGLA